MGETLVNHLKRRTLLGKIAVYRFGVTGCLGLLFLFGMSGTVRADYVFTSAGSLQISNAYDACVGALYVGWVGKCCDIIYGAVTSVSWDGVAGDGGSCAGWTYNTINGYVPWSGGFDTSGTPCASGVFDNKVLGCIAEDAKQRGTPKICAKDTGLDIATGNVFVVQANGPGSKTDGGSLPFKLYYNKSGSGGEGIGDSNAPHWTNTYSRAILVDDAAIPPAAVLSRPDGAQYIFRSVSGVWTPDADVDSHLMQLTDGSWQYTTANDTVEAYNANGQLQTMRDVLGNVQTITYSTTNPDQIDRVDGGNGDFLTFKYDSAGHIQSVTDRSLRTWGYRYDADDNLQYVDNPDSTTRQYVYNEQTYTENANQPHALTGIIDERGKRYATFEYYADGRAKASYHADDAG